MQFSAKSILSKKVMSTEAKELGILENIFIDQKNGNITYISISQKDELKSKKDNQSILIPFDSICAIKDYIIVEKDKMTSLST